MSPSPCSPAIERLTALLSRSTPLKVATHSGTFHCDEVVGVAMIRLLVGALKGKMELLRTREEELLKEADLVLDVGGESDPARLRFDHHQRGFEETFREGAPSKLSSAGLIYKNFGEKLLSDVIGVTEARDNSWLFNRFYDDFVLAVDAIDNGVPLTKGEVAYRVNSDLASRVKRLNPAWNEEGVDENERFLQAVEIAETEVKGQLEDLLRKSLPARSLVNGALERRFRGGRIVELPTPCPWAAHLQELEEEQGLVKYEEGDLLAQDGEKGVRVLYVIYPETKEKKKWRLQCVGEKNVAFKNRLSLPASLQGLRDGALVEASKIEGLFFVHHNGFIAGGYSRDSVIALAELSLNSQGFEGEEAKRTKLA